VPPQYKERFWLLTDAVIDYNASTSTPGEVDMFSFRTARVLLPPALATLIAAGGPATAATKGTAGKKLTYEQAWAFCKAQLDKRFG